LQQRVLPLHGRKLRLRGGAELRASGGRGPCVALWRGGIAAARQIRCSWPWPRFARDRARVADPENVFPALVAWPVSHSFLGV